MNFSSAIFFIDNLFTNSISKIILGLLITYAIILLSRRVIHTFFRKTDFLRDKNEQTIEAMLNSIIKYVATFGFIVYVLRIFNIEVGSILAGAGVIGVIVGFGAQHLIKDFLAGFFLLYEKQIHKGDWIKVNNTLQGTVEDIGFRFLKIRKWSSVLLTISNGQVQTIENFNIKKMRVIEHVTTSFYEQPTKVLSVLEDVCQKLNDDLGHFLKMDDNGNPIEPFQVYGISSLNDQFKGYQYTITGLCDDQFYFNAAKETRKVLAEAMYENNILMAEQPIVIHK